MSFMWDELKRRHVVKVGLAYVAVGWLLIEIASTLLPIFKAPPWVLPTVTSIIILGFPLALVLSWMFDLTPRGLERTRSDVQPDGASESITNLSERTLGLAIIGGLVLVLSFIVVDNYVLVDAPDEESNARDVLPNSVAVLPFANLSRDPDDAYFSAGLHEEILSKLAKLRNLSVISRTSVLRYVDSDLSIPEIAQELNVGTVMEGSVQYANDRVRINLNLIDATTDGHLWSETYDREFSDVFAIESDIATNIARAFRAELSLAEQEGVERAPTASAEAYRLYLSASQQGQQSDEVRLDLLDRAIEADPGFALPYVERASIRIQQQRTPGATASFRDRRAEPEALALRDLDKALVIDPTLGRAYAWLGMIHRYNWRSADARDAFATALEYSPSDSDVLVGYSYFLSDIGQHEEAIMLAERAVELDPNNSETHAVLGQVNATAGRDDPGRDDLAAHAFRIAAEHGAIWVHALAALVEIYRGDQAEAARQLLLSEPMTMTTDSPQWPALAAYTYARLDLNEDAARLLARFDELAAEQRVPAAADIMAHLARGEEEATLDRLYEAAEERAPYEAFNLLMSIAANRFRDSVFDKPAFADARGEIGFSDLLRLSVSLPRAEAGDRGVHPGPPPEAVEACADLSEGDDCGFSDPRRYVEGSCVFLRGSAVALVCVPPGGPPPVPPGR